MTDSSHKPRARALGVGGVFFRSADPPALAAWYHRWLGIPLEGDAFALFRPAAMPPGGLTVWAVFEQDTTYFQPDEHGFMVNLVVDDLDAALDQVAEGGAEVLPDRAEEPNGRFGWFIDPEGHKVELWQPAPGSDEGGS